MPSKSEKLANLLYEASIPKDLKEEWLTLLPKMSAPQLDTLLRILEVDAQDEATIVEDVIKNLKEISQSDKK